MLQSHRYPADELQPASQPATGIPNDNPEVFAPSYRNNNDPDNYNDNLGLVCVGGAQHSLVE